ncbi:single-strand DNA-binding protein [Brevibacterium sanguinis]|uniref:Single-stranded DNA-binding protein n=2 Tax=Brevibacterium TaxID=1696 RepID=A0A366IL24_9MICO|nr:MULTISPECIES: single-stranded DNA-binding protein [Brevibacterium]RBP66460.1 single-strand DNA-binding protein [Brevibacterium sanguinis]RBP73112.1 single-strand DNA-binding protein [Brevibacterium celere]
MSNIPINLSGTLAADPQSRTLPSGRACASFRLAVNHWRLERSTGEFLDDGTSWFAVDCYGQLASNVSMSLRQGMMVMVQGGLRIREWSTEERSGRTPTIVAEHIGPDLRYGTANYQKSSGQRPTTASSQTSGQQSAQPSGWDGLDDPPAAAGTSAGLPAHMAEDSERDDEGLSPVVDVGEASADPVADADSSDSPARSEDEEIARTTAAAAAPF